jgi:hypothetical protein
MKNRFGSIAFACLFSLLPLAAQTSSSNPASAVEIPRLVRFSGTLEQSIATTGANIGPGAAASGTAANQASTRLAVSSKLIGVTFALYGEETGGAPLWLETQSLQVDSAGHYTVLLGATKSEGLPLDVFTSGQAQWLGVKQDGQAEQPRVMLLSVPYALKAADAETFGGKPPSAYAPAPSSETSSTLGTASTAVGSSGPQKSSASSHPLPISGGGTTDYVPLWTNASTLSSSVIYQSPTHEIGIGTSNPVTPLEVTGNNSISIVDVTQTGSSGSAVSGDVTATSGNGYGVTGTTSSPAGTGVVGLNTATTGNAIGTAGSSSSASGVGVLGVATSPSGASFGVQGTTASPVGVGVIGENLKTSGVGYGVVGNSSSSAGVGINGNAASTTGANFGVFGQSFSTSGTGVSGAALATTGFAVGVAGNSDSTSGVGVVGTATAATGSAFGVKGVSGSSTGVGVLGIADTTAGANLGVEGMASSPAGAGVQGTNNSTTGDAFGVTALTVSTAGISLYGVAVEPSITTGAARPVAVWGSTNQSGAVAVAGTADDGYAMAAANYSIDSATVRFENQDPDSSALVVRTLGAGGSCFIDVSGNLLCEGTKSAVVPVDGGARKVALYAVEAPENWFEDAGSARLANGSAVVHMESIFAQTVNGGIEYHVFLTPKGDCKGLYVTNETGDSFEVRELGGGAANIAFDYRIMARRKGYENVRLADQTAKFKPDTFVTARGSAKPVSLVKTSGTPAQPINQTSPNVALPPVLNPQFQGKVAAH